RSAIAAGSLRGNRSFGPYLASQRRFAAAARPIAAAVKAALRGAERIFASAPGRLHKSAQGAISNTNSGPSDRQRQREAPPMATVGHAIGARSRPRASKPTPNATAAATSGPVGFSEAAR